MDDPEVFRRSEKGKKKTKTQQGNWHIFDFCVVHGALQSALEKNWLGLKKSYIRNFSAA